MSAQSQLRRLAWRLVAPLMGLAALGLAAFFWFHTPKPRTYQFTITAGDPRSTRHELTELLREEAGERGITLELRDSIGSEQSLDWVNSRPVDLALVQGGLSLEGRSNVRQVAALQIEPLHLLVKNELYAEVSKHLTALDGKTINLGELGSGTHSLAAAVLEFVGVHSSDGEGKCGYVPRPMSRKEMLTTETSDQLPDAIFVVSS